MHHLALRSESRSNQQLKKKVSHHTFFCSKTITAKNLHFWPIRKNVMLNSSTISLVDFKSGGSNHPKTTKTLNILCIPIYNIGLTECTFFTKKS